MADRTWPARQGDQTLSAKPPGHGAHGSAALLVAGLVGWASGSLRGFLIAPVAPPVASYYAGDVRR